MEKITAIWDQLSGTGYIMLAGLAGGFVDYGNKLLTRRRKWSFIGFCVHLLTACFFGWVSSRVASGLGYETDIIGAAAGVG